MTDNDHELSVHGAGDVTRERPGPQTWHPPLISGTMGPSARRAGNRTNTLKIKQPRLMSPTLWRPEKFIQWRLSYFTLTNRQRVNESAF